MTKIAGLKLPEVAPPKAPIAVQATPTAPVVANSGCCGGSGASTGTGAKKTESTPLIKKKTDVEIVEIKEKVVVKK